MARGRQFLLVATGDEHGDTDVFALVLAGQVVGFWIGVGGLVGPAEQLWLQGADWDRMNEAFPGMLADHMHLSLASDDPSQLKSVGSFRLF